MIESIEIDLLGRVGIAFDVWANRTGWKRDTEADFCWRCAGSVGPHEQDGEGCAACRSTKLPWDRALRLGKYKDELRRELLALKFACWRPGGRGMGRLLGQTIADQIDRAQLEPRDVQLVPIPTHPWRRVRRGIDHTQILTKAASDSCGCPISRVLRARHRPEQVGLSATARARNIKDAFIPRPKLLERVKAKHPVRAWVLIDDVRTTGATFTAASKALKRGLGVRANTKDRAEIWVCSVGVSPARDRRDA